MKDSNSLRKEFLNFFEKRGHKIVPSSSLIPTDSSVLFTSAGMQQFKPYFLGEESPYGKRVASCQKCLRTSDIESVGDDTHLTFFEMLGNFSFGDYFKKEAIQYALEFLTENCKLKMEDLWFTYFKGEDGVPEDTESKKILESLGIPKERIFGFGKKENFWGPTGVSGPCGPTVEIHYQLSNIPCDKKEKCCPNCQCGRFVEIWNLVFNEYYQDENKNLKPLRQKGVDTGMGLERLIAVVNNKENIFETDLFLPLIETINFHSKKDYSQHKPAFRIIADHIKASVFLISEGIVPGKTEREYVLRRLLRRCIRYAKMIEADPTLLIAVAKKVIEIYSSVYPELSRNKEKIFTVIQNEEEKFIKTIDRGLKEMEKILQEGQNLIKGEKAFYLYETFGFPLELIEEIAKEKGFKVDKEGFFHAQKKHQEISRIGSSRKFGGVGIDLIDDQKEKEKVIKLHTATHLLHQALRNVLGNEVKQMGSDINPERLRFDFSFPRKLTKEEIEEVEKIVNEQIQKGLVVIRREMTLDEALKMGALAFFKERYPEKVSVYIIGEKDDPIGRAFSKEVCAGPHVNNTSELGRFRIIKEESCGAGIRRIKAVLE